MQQKTQKQEVKKKTHHKLYRKRKQVVRHKVLGREKTQEQSCSTQTDSFRALNLDSVLVYFLSENQMSL